MRTTSAMRIVETTKRFVKQCWFQNERIGGRLV